MTWINLPSVSVQSGSKTVTVSNAQTTHIKVGDALLIGNYQPVEISGVFATQLTLRENWSNAAQTNVVAVVMPTSGDFVTATKVLKEATETTRSNFAALEKWATQMGTVEFKGQDNTTHTGRTFKQMDADVADLEAQASNLIINVSGRGFARSEADMLAMRAANATKFAASGMIHAGIGHNINNINEGMWVDLATPNTLFLGQSGAASGHLGTSKTGWPVFHFAGFVVHLRYVGYSAGMLSKFKFPEAPDGTVTYDSATGAVVKHPDAATAFASETATNKVVTERVDLACLEPYLEQITADKPYIYPYGCIQSQATAVDGIATTVDTIRPITYFAVFDGDESSRGRGWNINTLTDAQKEKIFSNPEHNIFRMNNGDLVQFRVRQRTIAGAGNGDWEGTNSASSGILAFSTLNLDRVAAQGKLDSMPSTSSGINFYAGTNLFTHNKKPSLGSFTVSVNSGTAQAYNGECYFYVLATVLRLNQGAYHPKNELGTRGWSNSSSVSAYWYNAGDVDPISKKDCFIVPDPVQMQRGDPHHGSGYIAATTSGAKSGRPDGKFYDAIYLDGEGGVIDRRLSAFPVTLEDYFKAISKAENGSMRGMEKLVWTKVSELSTTGATVSGSDPSLKFLSGSSSPRASYSQGELANRPYYVVNGDTKEVVQIGFGVALSSAGILHTYFPSSWTASNVYVVFGVETNLSVSGNFLQTDVIGDPANILQVDALKDGWMGSWLGAPNGAKRYKDFQLSRSIVGGLTLSSQPYTLDNGVTWQTTGIAVSDVTNSPISDLIIQSNHVGVWSYTAAAKVTKPSVVLPVYGSRSGLGPVITTEHNAAINGALLGESLMGKVLTASGVNTGLYAIPLSLLRLDPATGKLAGYDQPKHAAIPLAAPNNNSPAIKVLPHAVSDNGQATLGFVWNELKHNGVNWGDDGTMRVIDNTGTYNNLNEQSCLYGYAVSALPIGWVGNHARFGAQVPGVDL
ncbi:hypothetical protein BOO29_11105 [Vibrio navarrensis]|uniref:hypothetical protein n=1 Tax=Vibrio navarrensis TaxID=29495 RepID=UPI00186A116D|nr:hypothetical protein [Vibrio navarrensis]MBE4585510.1 hypothetical protein [Vibrio navarrensis]